MPIMGDEEGLVGGRYTIERRLGKGGVGEVFLAHDTQLARWVAIKRIHLETSETVLRGSAAMLEAKHLASLQHPNIVTVYDLLKHNSDVLVVMEFVNGQTLEEIESPLTMDDFVKVARQSLEGLAAAHTLGLIHRDIKSANIMLASLPTGEFQVKILDFGLAKVIDQPSLQTTDLTGSLLGSIFTMAPEQLEQRPIDARTDLYSLGCVLYRALTRRDPFLGETVAAVMAAHLQHRYEPLVRLRPDLSPKVCAWVERLFAWDPDDRPSSSSQAGVEFQECLRRPAAQRVAIGPVSGPAKPVAKRRSGLLWIVAAGVLGLLVVLGVTFFAKVNPEMPAAVETPTPAAKVRTMSFGDREEFLAKTGQAVVMEGVIGRVGENKAGTIRYLNFEGGKRGDLALVFFLKNGNTTFSMERLGEFVGQRVSVAGTVSEYQGNPQIEIADLSQITVMPPSRP